MKSVFHASVNPEGLIASPKNPQHWSQTANLSSTPLLQGTCCNFKWYSLSLLQGSNADFI